MKNMFKRLMLRITVDFFMEALVIILDKMAKDSHNSIDNKVVKLIDQNKDSIKEAIISGRLN